MADAASEHAEKSQLFADCLAQQGFDIAPTELSLLVDGPPEEDVPTFIHPLEYAQRWGLGFAPVALEHLDGPPPGAVSDSTQDPETPLRSRSSQERLQLDEAVVQCRDSVRLDEQPAALVELGRISADAMERLAARREFQALLGAWSECMDSQGYSIPSPELLDSAASVAFTALGEIESLPVVISNTELPDREATQAASEIFGGVSSLDELAALEVRVAVASVGCKSEIDFDDKIGALYSEEVARVTEQPSG